MTKPELEDTSANKMYVLVYGLPFTEGSYEIATGLTLRSIRERLSVFDLAALGRAGFREWAALEPFIHGCVCEIESLTAAAKVPGFDALNRAWLVMSLLALKGHAKAKGVAVNTTPWSEVALPGTRKTRNDLPRFEGSLLDLHFHILSFDTGPRCDLLSDLRWSKTVFPVANKLIADSPAFLLALHSATNWRFSPDVRSAIAMLWSGIEAIFSINSELSFRIALYAASVLEHRGESRLTKYKKIKSLYTLRSKAVHGEKMKEADEQAALVQSHQLLVDLLVSILDRGKIYNQADFDQAVFMQ